MSPLLLLFIFIYLFYLLGLIRMSGRGATLKSKGRSTLGMAGSTLMGGPSVLREVEGEGAHVSSVLAATPPQRKSVFSSEPFRRTYGSNPRASAAAAAASAAASEPAPVAASLLRSSLKSEGAAASAASASPRKSVTVRNNLKRVRSVPSGPNNKLLRKSINVNKSAAGANMRLLKAVFGERWNNANVGLNDKPEVKQQLIAEYTTAVTQYERKKATLLQRFFDIHGVIPPSNISSEYKKRSNVFNARLKSGEYTQHNYNFAKLNLNADRKVWQETALAAASLSRYDASKAAIEAEYKATVEAIKAKYTALIS